MSVLSRILTGGAALGALGFAGYKGFKAMEGKRQFRKDDARVDTAMDESFPASDPPAFTADKGVCIGDSCVTDLPTNKKNKNAA